MVDRPQILFMISCAGLRSRECHGIKQECWLEISPSPNVPTPTEPVVTSDEPRDRGDRGDHRRSCQTLRPRQHCSTDIFIDAELANELSLANAKELPHGSRPTDGDQDAAWIPIGSCSHILANGQPGERQPMVDGRRWGHDSLRAVPLNATCSNRGAVGNCGWGWATVRVALE